MRVASVLGAAALFLLASAGTASAASFGPCPSSTGPLTSATYTANGGLCNVVITFNADGSITTLISNAAPYDGSEDTLVGIVNNSTSIISSIVLTGSGGLQLFGFDEDGACVTPFSFVTAAACGSLHTPTANGADYAGPGVTFTGISANLATGTVNFAGGIAANGGTAWFSLEEPPSLNIIVSPSTAPEPASMLLLGTGLAGAGLRRLRNQRNR